MDDADACSTAQREISAVHSLPADKPISCSFGADQTSWRKCRRQLLRVAGRDEIAMIKSAEWRFFLAGSDQPGGARKLAVQLPYPTAFAAAAANGGEAVDDAAFGSSRAKIHDPNCDGTSTKRRARNSHSGCSLLGPWIADMRRIICIRRPRRRRAKSNPEASDKMIQLCRRGGCANGDGGSEGSLNDLAGAAAARGSRRSQVADRKAGHAGDCLPSEKLVIDSKSYKQYSNLRYYIEHYQSLHQNVTGDGWRMRSVYQQAETDGQSAFRSPFAMLRRGSAIAAAGVFARSSEAVCKRSVSLQSLASIDLDSVLLPLPAENVPRLPRLTSPTSSSSTARTATGETKLRSSRSVPVLPVKPVQSARGEPSVDIPYRYRLPDAEELRNKEASGTPRGNGANGNKTDATVVSDSGENGRRRTNSSNLRHRTSAEKTTATAEFDFTKRKKLNALPSHKLTSLLFLESS